VINFLAVMSHNPQGQSNL